MTPTIIVYGNCQAGMFASALGNFKESAAALDVRYLRSFVHPTEAEQQISMAEVARCRLVLEQADANHPLPDWLQQNLPSAAAVLRFPPIDFNLLWPLNFKDPRNVSEPPDYPFGRFPYGDRIVVELLREGLLGEELWREYQTRSIARMPDLDRLRDHEARRLAARDAGCDIKIAALIWDHYTRMPLFWTINHPTGWLLGQVFAALLEVGRAPLELTGDVRARAEKLFSNLEPFGHQHQPIHPQVAMTLGLAWCGPDRTYRYFDNSLMTFEQFMRRYIDFR